MKADDLVKYIEIRTREEGKEIPTEEDFNRYAQEFMKAENSRSIPEFEGYSPADMHQIIHCLLGKYCPVQFVDFHEEDCLQIPLYNQIKLLAQTIKDEGCIKLTKTGNLPTRLLSALYPIGIPEKYIEMKITKRLREPEIPSIRLAHLVILKSGVVKKRQNALSITKAGEAILTDPQKLLFEIFVSALSRINIAAFDAYGSPSIGNFGIGFTLLLLHKYGQTERISDFYAEKFFKAFPMLLDQYPARSHFRSPEREAYDCYSFRTFESLLLHLGLISIKEEVDKQTYTTKIFTQRTNVFEKLFRIYPPNHFT